MCAKAMLYCVCVCIMDVCVCMCVYVCVCVCCNSEGPGGTSGANTQLTVSSPALGFFFSSCTRDSNTLLESPGTVEDFVTLVPNIMS